MTLLADLIEIPEQVHKSDFVISLATAIGDPADTVRDYVVTDQLVHCFDRALSLVATAVADNRSKASYPTSGASTAPAGKRPASMPQWPPHPGRASVTSWSALCCAPTTGPCQARRVPPPRGSSPSTPGWTLSAGTPRASATT